MVVHVECGEVSSVSSVGDGVWRCCGAITVCGG